MFFLRVRSAKAMEDHRAWFDAHGMSYEPAAPRGWLEGNPGIYAVFFESPDDPRVAAYAAAFENDAGVSLSPEAYQMSLLSYAAWSQRQGHQA